MLPVGVANARISTNGYAQKSPLSLESSLVLLYIDGHLMNIIQSRVEWSRVQFLPLEPSIRIPFPPCHPPQTGRIDCQSGGEEEEDILRQIWRSCTRRCNLMLVSRVGRGLRFLLSVVLLGLSVGQRLCINFFVSRAYFLTTSRFTLGRYLFMLFFVRFI